MTENEYALIVAGGKGTRFKSTVPKQFLELNGKPVLLHTLEAFYQYSDKVRIVLVLPEEDQETWSEISGRHNFKKPVIVQAGGATRFQSVKKGLEHVGEGYVAIHDGVRPLVNTEIIQNSFRLARIYRSAVAAVSLKESIREIGNSSAPEGVQVLSGTKAVDRSLYRMIQTPQTFQTDLIRRAYALPEETSLTDDASVAEKAGFPIFLFEGSFQNIKITTPEDLAVAEALLRLRSDL